MVRVRGEGNVHLTGRKEGNLASSIIVVLALHVPCHGKQLGSVHMAPGTGILYHLGDGVKGNLVFIAQFECAK